MDIVLLYFATIIAIGLYKGRGSKDLESFAVGNRNIPWWAVLASILAAEISAATFLGAPGEGCESATSPTRSSPSAPSWRVSSTTCLH